VTTPSSPFDLPPRLAAKTSPALIDRDERHFSRIADGIARVSTEVADTLAATLATAGGSGQQARERDLEVHRLTSRANALRRYALDLCLGRMVQTDATDPVYIGRLGLTGADGERLLVDWRSPAAEPFFGATHANPMGLASRRRYRWTRGRITDYWDEVFTPGSLEGEAALDDQSAFIASLGSSRSTRMRDVLGTIQADQDAIIRAGSQGALVVDGGPGTGKTVVALHRTAYLLYADPRLSRSRGGVLLVGPNAGYLAYVDDVLPSLGEEGVQVATLRDLVAEGGSAVAEVDARVAGLKASVGLVRAVETAIGLSETPPTRSSLIETPWCDVVVEPDDWAEAFDAADPGSTHNDARDEIWQALLTILEDKVRIATGDDPDEEESDDFDAYALRRDVQQPSLRRALAADATLRSAFARAWPLLDAPGLVAALLSDESLLRRCAPWLSDDDVSALHRQTGEWTVSDLPLLDAARQRLGDPHASAIRERREAAARVERERMNEVIDQLIETDDSELGIMKMLRGQDLRATLVDETAMPTVTPDQLAGPFSHIVVDEAQELTDAEWQMLLARCPSGSFTIVGDRAQARNGFDGSWQQRLERIGLERVAVASLSVNYRTPHEVMAEAEPVIRAALPDANVPVSVRSNGIPVRHGRPEQLPTIVDDWLDAHADGTVCVIGADFERPRVSSLSPELSKGLEFDLVVLVEPERFSAVDRYVAMTRATQQLVVLAS